MTYYEANGDNAYVVSHYDEDHPKAQLSGVFVSDDPVRDYMREIGKEPLLDAEQEVELSKNIEAGLYAKHLMTAGRLGELAVTEDEANFLIGLGEQSKQKMQLANLRLVVSIAKRYRRGGMPFLDVIQEGNMGLVRAVEKFDFEKGYKFSTYATWWIRQAITRAMAEQGRTIRIPVHAVETLNRIYRVRRQMSAELGREPTDSEVARDAGIELDRMIELEKAAREPISLHTPVGAEGDGEVGDLLAHDSDLTPDDVAQHHEFVEKLNVVIDTLLTYKEADVLRKRKGMYDGKPMTLDEIGLQYGVTRERIRQIESKAMLKLKSDSSAQVLRDFLQ